ncbi:uncharacterized protein EI97DRAFT_152552 [Westerdykella ornata]|uniref:Uncharacterized protein n=1 Tax=Westerdykella ornata TaxID=318751 RepID=A0A6A6JBE7_WESOR|nr:uncharacterized protein EI97DRAFT_152552 [Westerdykella ornata]KAF2273524.1 hypothetical protein EI97DRAFT_152552 [Westerdykella ornata]
MVKLRVKSSVQKTPRLTTPIPAISSSKLMSTYTAQYDLAGNLSIFHLYQGESTWGVFRYYQTGPCMQWVKQDTGVQIPTSLPRFSINDTGFISSTVAEDGTIYVAVAGDYLYDGMLRSMAVNIQCGTFPPNNVGPPTWVGGLQFYPASQDYAGCTMSSIALSMVPLGPDAQQPQVCAAITKVVRTSDVDTGAPAPCIFVWNPISNTTFEAFGGKEEGDFTPFPPGPVARQVVDAFYGKYQDPLRDPTCAPVWGWHSHIDPPQPSPSGRTLSRDADATQAFIPRLGEAGPSTHLAVKMKVVYLDDKLRPKQGLSPLLFAISKDPRVGDPAAGKVVFLPNTQYDSQSPPETFTVLFNHNLSSLSLDSGAFKATWIDAVVEDLSDHPNGGVQGTNWRVHVFALFTNADGRCKLMHTWSFQAEGGGGSGVVEISPGVFDIPEANWSLPVVITTDLLNVPCSLSMFGNLCTLTVLNGDSCFTTWSQLWDSPTTRGVWTMKTVAVPNMAPTASGQAMTDTGTESCFYLELAAMDESPDGLHHSPKPYTIATLGSDSQMNFTANGRNVQLGPGLEPVVLTFNAAGLLGIEMPIAIAGSKAQALFSYPLMFPPTFWIGVDGMDGIQIDLLLTPSSLFDTLISPKFGVDSLRHVQKSQPPSGIPGLNPDYFNDEGSTSSMILGLQQMISILLRPRNPQPLEQEYLTRKTQFSPNAAVRLKSDPCKIEPATMNPVAFEMNFVLNYYRTQKNPAKAILKATYSTTFAPIIVHSAVEPASPVSVLCCADMIQNIASESQGYIRSIAVDCRGPSMLVRVVWARYSPLGASDSGIGWVSEVKTAHDFGLLFSFLLSYAGLYGDTIATWLNGATWIAEDRPALLSVLNSVQPLLNRAEVMLSDFSKNVLPPLDASFFKSLYGPNGDGITKVFNDPQTPYGSYSPHTDNMTLKPDGELGGLPACEISNRLVPSFSWVYNQLFEIDEEIVPTVAGRTAGPTIAKVQDLLLDIHNDLDAFSNANLFDSLCTLWNTFTTNSAFDNTPCTSIFPPTTPVFLNAVDYAQTLSKTVTSLASVLADDEKTTLLGQPLQSPRHILLYQALTTEVGKPAPVPTLSDFLALILTIPIYAIGNLLPEDHPPADWAFKDVGLLSLAATYYGLNGLMLPSFGSADVSRSFLFLAFTGLSVTYLEEGPPEHPSGDPDPIILPYMVPCLEAQFTVSYLQGWLMTSSEPLPITQADMRFMLTYLNGLASYALYASTIYSILKLGNTVDEAPEAERLVHGYTLWSGLAGIGNMLQMPGMINPSRSASGKAAPLRVSLSANIGEVAFWARYVGAACAFRARKAREVDAQHPHSKPRAETTSASWGNVNPSRVSHLTRGLSLMALGRSPDE